MIALYGGTFDPVHLGHLSVARQASSRLGDVQVRLLLSARPSHRGATGADIEHRWAMLKLACQDDHQLVPDRREVDRAGPSYAVVTLEALRAEVGDTPLCWIVGQDSFATLPSWFRWQSLFELSHFLVVPRPGTSNELPAALRQAVQPRLASSVAELSGQPAGRVWITELATPDVSSTDIRKRASRGQALTGQVPPAVECYQAIHRLYQSPSAVGLGR